MDTIQIHLSHQSVDTEFFDFYNFTNNDKIIFLSYNFNDKELAVKFGSFEDYTIKNRIEDKDPLNNLEQYKDEKYNNYEIFIEGIDFEYINNNQYAILANFKKVINRTVKYHFNIINVPIDKEEKFRDKFGAIGYWDIKFLPKKHKSRKWNDL